MLAALPSQGMTVVVLMGLAERATVASTLIESGWAPTTPAAVVIGAATPAAWRWMGTLDQLGAVALPQRRLGGTGFRGDAAELDDTDDGPGGSPPPGLLVIGQVVEVATQLEAMKKQITSTSDSSSSSDSQSTRPSGEVRG
jgi:siroheme synthase